MVLNGVGLNGGGFTHFNIPSLKGLNGVGLPTLISLALPKPKLPQSPCVSSVAFWTFAPAAFLKLWSRIPNLLRLPHAPWLLHLHQVSSVSSTFLKIPPSCGRNKIISIYINNIRTRYWPVRPHGYFLLNLYCSKNSYIILVYIFYSYQYFLMFNMIL